MYRHLLTIAASIGFCVDGLFIDNSLLDDANAKLRQLDDVVEIKGDFPLVEGPYAYVADPCVPEDTTTPRHTSIDGVEFVRNSDTDFASLAEAGFPFEPKYVELDEGMRMHYIDEGPSDGEILLMAQGGAMWCYSYRKMIRTFVELGFRAMCADVIGSGRSDKPVSVHEHTYTKHVSNMKEFIQKKIPEALVTPSINFIGHHYGAMIGLRVVADESSWFRRVIMANGQFTVLPQFPNPIIKIPDVNYNCSDTRTYWEYRSDRDTKASEMGCGPIDKSCFGVWVDYTSNSPAYQISDAVSARSPNVTSMELAQYDAPFPSSIYRSALRVFPSMILRFKDGNNAAWERLKNFERPYLVLAGALDPDLGSTAVMSRFIENIIGAKVHSFEHKRWAEAATFIQEDIGKELAIYISDFVRGTPLTVSPSKYSKKTKKKAVKGSKKEAKIGSKKDVKGGKETKTKAPKI